MSLTGPRQTIGKVCRFWLNLGRKICQIDKKYFCVGIPTGRKKRAAWLPLLCCNALAFANSIMSVDLFDAVMLRSFDPPKPVTWCARLEVFICWYLYSHKFTTLLLKEEDWRCSITEISHLLRIAVTNFVRRTCARSAIGQVSPLGGTTLLKSGAKLGPHAEYMPCPSSPPNFHISWPHHYGTGSSFWLGRRQQPAKHHGQINCSSHNWCVVRLPVSAYCSGATRCK